MKKCASRGEIKWKVTMKMNNEDSDKAPILACSWKDSGVVYFLSTAHSANDMITVERQSGANRIEVNAPAMVEDYCKGMGGVDLADQYRSSYCVRQKSMRWYLCLFYWFLGASIANSFACVMHHESNVQPGSKTSHLTFRKHIIHSLIGFSISPSENSPTFTPKLKRPRLNDCESLPYACVSDASHLPIKQTRHRCQWCHLMKGEEHRTNYVCRECNVSLCIECFAPFHDYRD